MLRANKRMPNTLSRFNTLTVITITSTATAESMT